MRHQYLSAQEYRLRPVASQLPIMSSATAGTIPGEATFLVGERP